MDIIKIKDSDSGEAVEQEVCQVCYGAGGYDASSDCEVFDNWQSCARCDGYGYVELGHFERESFDPKRDAWTLDD